MMDSLTKNCFLDEINKLLNVANDDTIFLVYNVLTNFKAFTESRCYDDERE